MAQALVGLVVLLQFNRYAIIVGMASLAVVAAALGRIAPLNDWYAGTWLEHWFSAFVSILLLGALLLGVKCAIEKRFDRWFAGGLAALPLYR